MVYRLCRDVLWTLCDAAALKRPAIFELKAPSVPTMKSKP
jgi:hypothetical protein